MVATGHFERRDHCCNGGENQGAVAGLSTAPLVLHSRLNFRNGT